MMRKGDCVMPNPAVAGEVRFVNRLFYLARLIGKDRHAILQSY